MPFSRVQWFPVIVLCGRLPFQFCYTLISHSFCRFRTPKSHTSHPIPFRRWFSIRSLWRGSLKSSLVMANFGRLLTYIRPFLILPNYRNKALGDYAMRRYLIKWTHLQRPSHFLLPVSLDSEAYSFFEKSLLIIKYRYSAICGKRHPINHCIYIFPIVYVLHSIVWRKVKLIFILVITRKIL